MKIQTRREALYLLVVAMDSCWMAPLAAIICGLVGLPPLPVAVIVALYLAAFFSGRLVTWLRLDDTRSRVVAVFLAAVTILLVLKVAHYGSYPWLGLAWLGQLALDLVPVFTSVPPASFTIIAGVAIWWAGLRLSAQHISRGLMSAHFTAGLIVFVFVLLLGAMRGVGDLSSPIFIFFAAGLLGVAMARMESMTSGRQSPLSGYWLTMLVLIILLVMAAGLLAMDAFSAAEAGGDSFMAVLTIISGFIGNLIVLLLTPFGYLAYWIILLLERLVGRSQQSVAPIDLAPPPPTQERDLQAPELPFVVEQILRALPMVILLIVAVWLLGKAMNRRRTPLDEDAEEVRDSAGSLSDFWSDVIHFFRRLLGLAGGRARRGVQAVASALRFDESDPALTVRQIYARLLHLAASRGEARRADQTAYEYLPDLQAAIPTAGEDAVAITETYVHARYGCAAPAPQAVTETRSAWDRIKKGLPEKR